LICEVDEGAVALALEGELPVAPWPTDWRFSENTKKELQYHVHLNSVGFWFF
jgi:hypothetical protein